MIQPQLFDVPPSRKRLDTFVAREGSILNIPEGLQTTPCTHGLHRFPGKFIPNIPRYLLRSVLPSGIHRTVLDPFCGSGTTLVEAALEGRSFIGIDIDPLSVAISNAKLDPLSEEDLSTLEHYWTHHDYRRTNPEHVPDVPNLSHWFTDQAISELTSLKSKCLALPTRLRLFSLVVFSSIIRRVSNADDQTQKTYVSHTLPKHPPLPSALFPIFLHRAIQGMREYVSLLPAVPHGRVVRGDARELGLDTPITDVLTSPPYIDSIDYVYNQMLEYYWLLSELQVDTTQRLATLRKEPMGFRLASTLMVHANPFVGEYAANFAALCSQIAARSPKEAQAVRSFFQDYVAHVEAMRLLQPEHGFYVSIVGNSLIRGVTIPTADLLVAIHEANGYRLVDRMQYEIRRHYMKFPRRSNSGKINYDHILVFEAT